MRIQSCIYVMVKSQSLHIGGDGARERENVVLRRRADGSNRNLGSACGALGCAARAGEKVRTLGEAKKKSSPPLPPAEERWGHVPDLTRTGRCTTRSVLSPWRPTSHLSRSSRPFLRPFGWILRCVRRYGSV